MSSVYNFVPPPRSSSDFPCQPAAICRPQPINNEAISLKGANFLSTLPPAGTIHAPRAFYTIIEVSITTIKPNPEKPDTDFNFICYWQIWQ